MTRALSSVPAAAAKATPQACQQGVWRSGPSSTTVKSDRGAPVTPSQACRGSPSPAPPLGRGRPSWRTRPPRSRPANRARWFGSPPHGHRIVPVRRPSLWVSARRRSRRRSSPPSAAGAARGVAHLGHRLVDGEAGRLLARREVLERRQERPHDRLRREDDVVMVEEPVVVRVRRDVGPLERVGSQVEQLRESGAARRAPPTRAMSPESAAP